MYMQATGQEQNQDQARGQERTGTVEQRNINYNFTPVERSRPNIAPLEHCVRISRTQIGVSGDVAQRFKSEVVPSGRKKYQLAILVDDVNQAIQIREPREGEPSFRFYTPNPGHSTTGYINCAVPARLREFGLPKGDYVEVAHGVFQLAK